MKIRDKNVRKMNNNSDRILMMAKVNINNIIYVGINTCF